MGNVDGEATTGASGGPNDPGRTDVASSRSQPIEFCGIDHVQLAIPPGGEDRARDFFVGRLGMAEVPRPTAIAARGGAWFEAGATVIHVGVEPDFVAARKAHPALAVRGVRALVERAGLTATWSDEIPGVERCHVHDPFGNRIELVEVGDR